MLLRPLHPNLQRNIRPRLPPLLPQHALLPLRIPRIPLPGRARPRTRRTRAPRCMRTQPALKRIYIPGARGHAPYRREVAAPAGGGGAAGGGGPDGGEDDADDGDVDGGVGHVGGGEVGVVVEHDHLRDVEQDWRKGVSRNLWR